MLFSNKRHGDGQRPRHTRRTSERGRVNAVVLLIIGLPAFAIAASVGTAILAVTRGDAPLPDQYHWEGDKLDHDFAGARKAEELRVDATLNLSPDHGRCHATLRIESAPPQHLRVTLIHISQPGRDRVIDFAREAHSSNYTAPCSSFVAGRWHVELADPQAGWAFRQETVVNSDEVTLSTLTAPVVRDGP